MITIKKTPFTKKEQALIKESYKRRLFNVSFDEEFVYIMRDDKVVEKIQNSFFQHLFAKK